MGATTMFANLYVFSGSNHLMAVPTGVLFSRVPELDGGVVRVDWTDSAHFNNIHPHEKTKVRVRAPATTCAGAELVLTLAWMHRARTQTARRPRQGVAHVLPILVRDVWRPPRHQGARRGMYRNQIGRGTPPR